MSSILKLFRVLFFYALYFLLCMVAVVTVLQGWPVGGQMLFAFGFAPLGDASITCRSKGNVGCYNIRRRNRSGAQDRRASTSFRAEPGSSWSSASVPLLGRVFPQEMS